MSPGKGALSFAQSGSTYPFRTPSPTPFAARCCNSAPFPTNRPEQSFWFSPAFSNFFTMRAAIRYRYRNTLSCRRIPFSRQKGRRVIRTGRTPSAVPRHRQPFRWPLPAKKTLGPVLGSFNVPSFPPAKEKDAVRAFPRNAATGRQIKKDPVSATGQRFLKNLFQSFQFRIRMVSVHPKQRGKSDGKTQGKDQRRDPASQKKPDAYSTLTSLAI